MCLSEVVTQEEKQSVRMEVHVQASSRQGRQIRPVQRRGVTGSRNLVGEAVGSHCQEKLLANISLPVPQTDTGSWEENSKVSERTLVKELGKMTP